MRKSWFSRKLKRETQIWHLSWSWTECFETFVLLFTHFFFFFTRNDEAKDVLSLAFAHHVLVCSARSLVTVWGKTSDPKGRKALEPPAQSSYAFPLLRHKNTYVKHMWWGEEKGENSIMHHMCEEDTPSAHVQPSHSHVVKCNQSPRSLQGDALFPLHLRNLNACWICVFIGKVACVWRGTGWPAV